jgi:hypothetical protein
MHGTFLEKTDIRGLGRDDAFASARRGGYEARSKSGERRRLG